MDMEFHTLRGADLSLRCGNIPTPLRSTSVYANAQMFGGIASESFKIKRSRLIQAGKSHHF